MNSLPLSPLVISFFILCDFYWENRCLEILRNAVTLNSYLGFSALRKKNFFLFCFVTIRFSQHDRTITQIPNMSSSARSHSPPSPTQVF